MRRGGRESGGTVTRSRGVGGASEGRAARPGVWRVSLERSDASGGAHARDARRGRSIRSRWIRRLNLDYWEGFAAGGANGGGTSAAGERVARSRC